MAVPAGAIAERRLIMRLLRAGAVSADTAAPLDGLRWIQARRLARLLAAGVVREAAPQRYYLEAPALADRLTARRRRALFLMLIVLALFGLGTYLVSAGLL
jgi:hypothetical protein